MHTLSIARPLFFEQFQKRFDICKRIRVRSDPGNFPIPPSRAQKAPNCVFVETRADHLRRYAANDGIWRHILNHNRAGKHNRSIADRNTINQTHIRANPHVVADYDIVVTVRISVFVKFLRIHKCDSAWMVRAVKRGVGGNEMQRMRPLDPLYLLTDRAEAPNLATRYVGIISDIGAISHKRMLQTRT